MWLEQLVTAGTITEFEIWKLRRRYRYCLKHFERMRSRDPEATVPKLGKLDIAYYQPRERKARAPDEPTKSHLKLTIFDDKIAVLGSGNQDRASWYTSQELGIAFNSEVVVTSIRKCVRVALEDRLEYFYSG